MHAYRTHTCGALTQSAIGQTVKLSGWIHRKRDHGGVLFIDLRDTHGITQCVAEGNAVLADLRVESVVTIIGEVVPRAEGTVNTKMKTGEIEVVVKDEALADLSVYKPKDMDSLLHVRTLPPDVAKGKLGPVLLKLIEQARATDPATWPKVEHSDPFPKRAQGTLEMLKMLLRINAADNDVAAKLIATSEDLERLAVEDNPDIPALHGWRREIFGEEALAMKDGRLALTLKKGRIVKAAH